MLSIHLPGAAKPSSIVGSSSGQWLMSRRGRAGASFYLDREFAIIFICWNWSWAIMCTNMLSGTSPHWQRMELLVLASMENGERRPSISETTNFGHGSCAELCPRNLN